jgi:DNA replication initiation complex subunit (GINS family)
MNLKAIRRALEAGYEDRGVFEPEEKFWKAVKQVIDMLETNNEEKKRPEWLSRRRVRKLGNR